MAKNNSFWHIALISLLLIVLQLTACDAASEDDTDPTGATPSVTVGKAIGPANQLIAQDTLAVANEISDNTTIALQSVYNFTPTTRDDRILFQASVNTDAINDIYSLGTDTGTLSLEALSKELTADGAGATTWPGSNCTDAGVCECFAGGTRTYTGTLDITVDTGSLSGNINGDYSITYAGCIELIQLEVEDSPCTMALQLDGTIEQTVNIDFSNFQETNTNDSFVTSADRSIFQSSETQTPISFSNAADTSSSFTSAEPVDFNFTYDFTDGTAIVEPISGSVIRYDGVEYNMVTLQEFIESSTNSEVCP